MSEKEQVQAVFPRAYAHQSGDYYYVYMNDSLRPHIGDGMTEDAAWNDALERLNK